MKKTYGITFLASVAILLLGIGGVSAFAQTTSIINGTFETGNLAGWTASGINGSSASVVQEGTCFSANNTLGLTLNGHFAANVRSSGPAPTDSVGILTSDPFVAGFSIRFRALSENRDSAPAADPVTFEVRVLDAVGNIAFSQIVKTNIVTLSEGCPGGQVRDGTFSTHIIDTSALAGQTVRLEFRQHTNVAGEGFFTLIDDVEVLSATCDIQLNKTTFVTGDQVLAQVARLVNPGPHPVSVEVKLWFELPGSPPPLPFLTVGADGSFVLAPGFDKDFGPLALATVQASFPRGSYHFNCRLLHAVRGAPLGDDFNPFQLQ